MSDVECPYCNYEQEINHDDGYGYDESVTYEQECCHCEKHFAFTTEISFDHTASKADCFNDGDHKWESTWTHPREYSQWKCSGCGKSTAMEKVYIDKLKSGVHPKSLVRGES